MSSTLVILLIVIAVGLILLLMLFAAWHSTAARLVELRHQVHQAVGTEAAHLQERIDLLPNALHVAREAIQVQMIYLRQIQIGCSPASAASQCLEPSVAPPPELAPLTAAASAAAPRPPLDVKTYEKFMAIMELTEKDIAGARRFVQAAVAEYNAAITTFPTSLVAASRGFTPLPSRQITPELEKMPTLSTLPMLLNGVGNHQQLPNPTTHEQARNEV